MNISSATQDPGNWGSLGIRGPGAGAGTRGHWITSQRGKGAAANLFYPASNVLVSIPVLFPSRRNHRRSLLAWNISWLPDSTVKSRKSWTKHNFSQIHFVSYFCFLRNIEIPTKTPRKLEPTETGMLLSLPKSTIRSQLRESQDVWKWLWLELCHLPRFPFSAACSPQETGAVSEWVRGAGA